MTAASCQMISMHAFLLVPGDHWIPERKLTGTPEMARVINNHVGYACHRYIVHRPGTDPLRGLALPKKGSRIRIQGDKLIVSHRPPRRRRRERR